MSDKLPSNPTATLRRLNPHIFGPLPDAAQPTLPVRPGTNTYDVNAEPIQPKRIGKRRKQMNKTETAFAAILEAKVRAGEIVSFVYEGMTLRWGKLDNIQYTPDFMVIESGNPDGSLKLLFIETKGARIWAKDMAKFKQARNEWPLFRFEMWQRKKGDWAQLL